MATLRPVLTLRHGVQERTTCLEPGASWQRAQGADTRSAASAATGDRARHSERWSRDTHNWKPVGPVRISPFPPSTPAVQELKRIG